MSGAIKCFIVICLVFLTLLLPACSHESLKIGLMVDLTGRASEIGRSGRNGVEIAAAEVNQNGGINGRKIELIVRDDKGLPEEAEKIDSELVGEGILLGIGHFASGTGKAGLKVFSGAGKLMVSPTMSTESLTGLDDCFIRVIDSNKKQGSVLADAALQIGRNSRVAIMYEKNNSAYSLEVCDNFRQVFEKEGGKIVLEDSFESSPSMDFDRISDKISGSGADGALIVAGGLDLAVITQKIKLKNPGLDIYSGMWAMTGDLIKNGGKAVEGIYLPGVYDKFNQTPDFVSFRSQYTERYGEEPTFASIYGYETARMVFDALINCGNKYDTETIKASIIGLQTCKGLQQDFHVDRSGDTDRGYFLFQVNMAEFIKVR
jgi:branched-chain amino acid transport system substrate-binding protein